FALIIPLVVIGALLSVTEEQLCTTSTTGLDSTCSVPTGATVALWLLLVFIGFVGYLAIIFLIYIRPVAKTGQSIGRRLVGIRVVDQDTGHLISMGRAFGRYIFASFISGFFYIGYLWMLWDDNAQTLHDKVVRSVVVPAGPGRA
ncbi:MAG: RDD family protein, partial [Acidimicrobiia bacterium]|nr:RDD family protein [Acidimicrobiia bacterium]